MNILDDSLGSKDKLKLEKLNNIISYTEVDEQQLLLISSDTKNLNQLFETYFLNSLSNCIKIEDIKDGLFKSILSQLEKYKNKYILINLFDIKNYTKIMEEFQFKRDYIPQERLKFIFLFNKTQYESFKTKAYDFFSFNNFFHHFIDNSFTFVNDIDFFELDNMIDEYEKVKDTNISKQSRIKYLYDIGIKASMFSQNNIALEYFDKAIINVTKIKDNFMRALIYDGKSNSYLELGNLNKALINAKETLRIFKKLKDRRGIGLAYVTMGNIYKVLGNLELSLNNYNSALKISIKDKYNDLQAAILPNIGMIYFENDDYKLALKYQEDAYDINKKINNNRGISACTGNLGLIYQYYGDLKLALYYQNKSLNISKENNYIGEIAISLGNIGNIYKDKNDLELALKYQNEALTIFKDIGYMQGVSETLNDIGDTYEKLLDFEESSKYKKEAMDIAKTLGFNGIIAKIKKDINNTNEKR